MTYAVLWLKSLIFTIVFYIFTLTWTTLCLPAFLLPKKMRQFVPWVWSYVSELLVKWFCNVRVELKGVENLPKSGGYILASKHQSAMETLLFHSNVSKITYVLKRELTWIPIVGWWFWATDCIILNRSAAGRAMKKLLELAQDRMKKGLHLVIFPEGTRVPVGEKKPFSPGIALLYEKIDVPVIPVALNTGYCWPKNKLIKYPGVVTIEFLPPMEKGLERREFLKRLETTIQTAEDKLPKPNTLFEKYETK